MESITDMAYVDGKLVVAGLSNEEFASKLRTVPYPFAAVEAGTSVEIYHGNHGQFETRSPVISFVPYKIDNTAEPDRRLHLHAAREVPGRRASRLARRSWARRLPSSATAIGRPT